VADAMPGAVVVEAVAVVAVAVVAMVAPKAKR
jgi:hypothetical protein